MRFSRSVTGCILSASIGAAACGSETQPLGFCGEGQASIAGQCLADLPVATNTVGFLPSRVKKAVFTGSSPDFEVRDAQTGEIVLNGEASGPVHSADTDTDVYVADFSSLNAAGEYFIFTEGQESGRFTIGEDALDGPLDAAMLGLYGQRCGEAVEIDFGGNVFSHGAGHLAPALTSRLGFEGTRDDVGGWHDAGDYGKYVVNGAFSVAFLLKAYEHFPETLEKREFSIPEKGGKIPDILDEARVELEWILKTQLEDGSFAHKVTALRFEAAVMPGSDVQERFFYTASSASTADAVAVLALAARLYSELDASFSEICLKSAREGQVFLSENPQEFLTEQMRGGSYTGAYAADSLDPDNVNDRDERAWALIELWETTGESEYLSAFELIAPEISIEDRFDWGDVANLALIAYLDSENEGRSQSLVDEKSLELFSSAQRLTDYATNDSYSRATGAYYWGINGVLARTSYNLAAAHRLQNNTAYLDTLTSQLDHLYGLNGFARSFITGQGTNPAAFPHHRPSTADSITAPWPGLLIGGPWTSDESVPPGLAWQDDADNYRNNEIAINWNAALIYALVAAKATNTDESAACLPGCAVDTSELAGSATGAGGAGGGS